MQIDDSNSDLVQTVVFDDLNPTDSELQITVAGERAVQYQLLNDYYLPWSAQSQAAQEAVKAHVAYDRSEMKVNDRVAVTATVELQTEKQAAPSWSHWVCRPASCPCSKIST